MTAFEAIPGITGHGVGIRGHVVAISANSLELFHFSRHNRALCPTGGRGAGSEDSNKANHRGLAPRVRGHAMDQMLRTHQGDAHVAASGVRFDRHGRTQIGVKW
jgi:hypothetical protein